MKKLLLFLVGLFLTLISFSQDLIVTGSGDSINCVITKVKKDYIYFTFSHNGDIRNTLLPVSDVPSFQKGYFETPEVPPEKIKNNINYQRIRIALNGGFGYQTAKIGDNVPNDFRDYVKKLKSGITFGGDITYYFSETMGAGVKYSLFHSSNSLDNIYIENAEGERRYGAMSDDLNISYIGPSFSTRLLNHKKSNAMISSISLGYMAYNNDKVMVDKYKMTGSTLGLSFDLGYDIKIADKISLGIQLSYTSGTLFNYKWDDGNTIETIELEAGSYEGLNRIDLSVGLRF